MKKRKLIPPIVMLTAGLITSIATFWQRYPVKTALFILLAVLIVFYILGFILMKVLDSFEKEESAIEDEGEVIEKEIEEDGASGVQEEKV